ncbi:MAG: sigma factor, partial [Mycobacterium sp.]
MTAAVEEFEAQRSRLFGLAYRLLGSAAEAEDAIQDAYLRLHAADRAAI